MTYRLLRTDLFGDQLNDIIPYIASDTGAAEPALQALDRIGQDVLRLKEFPESGSPPCYTILRRQGYRVLTTQRWLVFYKVNHAEKTVTLYAITDQRREYLHLL